MDIATLTTFLGWVTAVNIGLFILAIVFLKSKRDSLVKFHAKIFGLKKEDLLKGYFQYLGRYKILIIFFNIVPYLILRMVILGE